MTVFDPSQLDLLVDDAASRPFVLELARTYQRMLPGRLDRVQESLAGPDVDFADALDAVLSLKVSSAMTGASEIADLARSVELALRAGDLALSRAEALRLPTAAAQADVALTEYLRTAQVSSDSIR